jgi:Tfp pilus assembly protein PilF
MRKNRKILPYNQNPEFFIKLGAKYINKGDMKSSLKYVIKAVEMQPCNPYYKYNLACIFAELQEFEKSNTIFEEILENLDPDLSDCYFEMGCNYFETGDFANARKCFENYSEHDPDGEYIDEVENALYYMDLYEKS